MRVNNRTIRVTTDEAAIVSHAGASLLTGLADKTGLTGAIDSELSGLQLRARAHTPGLVLRNLAVTLADGGDCLSDLAALREQKTLLGKVASDSTAYRMITATGPRLADLRAARAKARARAWDQGARPDQIVLDIDATLVTSHSDKEQARGNWKGGYGFHPLLCYLDATGEALAGVLRPGNAGANTAKDHIAVLEMALDQLPKADQERDILVRCDGAGASKDFLEYLDERSISFSVGFQIDDRVRRGIAGLPDEHWVSAVERDGQERAGAQVACLDVSLDGWPEGSRLICRRERAHPGAQLTLADVDGFRHRVFLTDRTGDIAQLELEHRLHAHVEDRIREAKSVGLSNLPFQKLADNQVWLELVLMAQDLLAWSRLMLLDGALAVAEPKTLRYRLFHQAGRVVRSGRRVTLKLAASWPWADALAKAFARLRALPSPAS